MSGSGRSARGSCSCSCYGRPRAGDHPAQVDVVAWLCSLERTFLSEEADRRAEADPGLRIARPTPDYLVPGDPDHAPTATPAAGCDYRQAGRLRGSRTDTDSASGPGRNRGASMKPVRRGSARNCGSRPAQRGREDSVSSSVSSDKLAQCASPARNGQHATTGARSSGRQERVSEQAVRAWPRQVSAHRDTRRSGG